MSEFLNKSIDSVWRRVEPHTQDDNLLWGLAAFFTIVGLVGVETSQELPSHANKGGRTWFGRLLYPVDVGIRTVFSFVMFGVSLGLLGLGLIFFIGALVPALATAGYNRVVYKNTTTNDN